MTWEKGFFYFRPHYFYILVCELRYTKYKTEDFSILIFFQKKFRNVCFAQELLSTTKPVKCHGDKEEMGAIEIICIFWLIKLDCINKDNNDS